MFKYREERRGKPGRRDSGARTRRTDHGHSPHVWQDWLTTFNLRWVEHLQGKDRNVRPRPA